MFSVDLLNALVAGVLLGGFYAAAVSLGISVTFAKDVVNIAHPVFVILGSYTAFVLNDKYGLDLLLSGLVFAPLFFVIGVAVYQTYYLSFEKKGESVTARARVLLRPALHHRGRAAAEVRRGLSPHRGALHRPLLPDRRGRDRVPPARAVWSGPHDGGDLAVPVADVLRARGHGRGAGRPALRLMGVDPVRIKTIVFGLGIATASVAGALLIMISPVEPSIGRAYIGRVFAITVLGGLGSIGGTLTAAMILGVAEPDVDVLGAVVVARGVVRHPPGRARRAARGPFGR